MVYVMLPSFAHPDILSVMGMVTKYDLTPESSVFSNEIVQFLFEQSIV